MSKKGGNLMMPTGELQGENVGALPDKGTTRGMTGKKMVDDGRSLDAGATNRIGGFRASSDDPGCCYSKTPLKSYASKASDDADD